MNYELAKKLEKSGLKIEHDHDFCVQNGCWFSDDYGDTGNILHRSTLSELIEACGEQFETLSWYQYPTIWLATGGDKDMKEFKGSTPEEAVANLWLELNKKS